MPLGDITPDTDDSSSGGKSTHIKFWNPRNAEDEISEGTEHRHEQEFYDAAQDLRNMVGQNINVPVGRFLVALRNSEKRANYDELADLLVTLGPDPESENWDTFVNAVEEAIQGA